MCARATGIRPKIEADRIADKVGDRSRGAQSPIATSRPRTEKTPMGTRWLQPALSSHLQPAKAVDASEPVPSPTPLVLAAGALLPFLLYAKGDPAIRRLFWLTQRRSRLPVAIGNAPPAVAFRVSAAGSSAKRFALLQRCGWGVPLPQRASLTDQTCP